MYSQTLQTWKICKVNFPTLNTVYNYFNFELVESYEPVYLLVENIPTADETIPPPYFD